MTTTYTEIKMAWYKKLLEPENAMDEGSPLPKI
jgi:hypothetical protein